jgi:hypothetical protein
LAHADRRGGVVARGILFSTSIDNEIAVMSVPGTTAHGRAAAPDHGAAAIATLTR